jgi:hypothetical protein
MLKKWTAFKFLFTVAVLVLVEFTYLSNASASVLTLSDSMIAANKGDFDQLYSIWIQPHKNKNSDFISYASRDEMMASEMDIKEGFIRFCSESGGKYNQIHGVSISNLYRCVSKAGSLIGEISTYPHRDTMLVVLYDSPQKQGQRALFEKLKAKNGPTGTIETRDGRFKFIRIGNFTQRDILTVELNKKADEYLPIEDVSRIDFPVTCCDIIVTDRGKKSFTVNISKIQTRMISDHQGGTPTKNFVLVVIDEESGQPYTRVFSSVSGVKSIVFDDPSVWDMKNAEFIKTAYNPLSQERMDSYARKLRIEANQLYAESVKNGTVKQSADENLTSELLTSLDNELARLITQPECVGHISTGITSPETLLKCRQALIEKRLFLSKGYNLSIENTPLSEIIINNIKNDMQKR